MFCLLALTKFGYNFFFNLTFLGSFVKLLQDYDGSDGTKGGFNGLHEENQRLRDENYKLKEKLVNANTSSEHKENDDGDEKLKNSFIKAQRDVVLVKTCFSSIILTKKYFYQTHL